MTAEANVAGRAALLEALAEGAEVDGFTLGRRIHKGAQGHIYAVERAGAGFPMLMKVPRLGAGESAESLLGYRTEEAILPLLSGPHVPRFVASGDLARTPYVVLERVEGENLESVVARAPRPADEVARLGAAIADALHAIHRQEVVHGDLKPDNVIVKPDGTAVLLDFGFAHHPRVPDLLAEQDRLAGSPPYISPEQVLRVRGDPRSDLFALGVILYELATRELPFDAPATLAGLRERLWLDPVPPRRRIPAFLPALQEVILRCLEPSASERYQSAAHVAFDLRNLSQVVLTERAERTRRASHVAHLSRMWKLRRLRRLSPGRPAAADGAPVILVAVDTMHPDDERQPAIRRAAQRVLSAPGESRLIFVSVVEPSLVLLDEADESPLEHLIRLRRWAEPLGLPPQRMTMHVIEGGDPANALLLFARRNNVDLIVLGAPGASQPSNAWWRSAASKVTAGAPCSVLVVRVPLSEERAPQPERPPGG
ncbi:MAG TPA: bifunctional serine/threonine-protein kinase/universal stress protein [Myxococcales bacterium]